MIRYELWTDGSCKGNPGAGGYAAILRASDGDTLVKEREVVGYETETTNNRMEMLSIIAGLEVLTSPVAITVYSDSAYVVNTMTRGFKRHKNLDLWERMDAMCAKHTVTFEKVAGHVGIELNERCDQLAREQSEIAERAR